MLLAGCTAPSADELSAELGAELSAGLDAGLDAVGDALASAGADPAHEAPTAAPAADAIPPDGPAAEALAGLEVKGRAPRTGYDRDDFGYRSFDPERNGCDSRNDVLRRDLDEVRVRPDTNGCVVETGVLEDPYSGERIDFVRGRGTSSEVQIDHVVALSDAWQKGAQAWDEPTRLAFANDPLNLLAVDGPLNNQKGAGDAATWLPPDKEARCPYVARQVAVKSAYDLWVTPAERDAIARVLETCPGQELPEREVAPLLP